MNENWFRWHVGTATDPKWRVVAARSGQPVASVLAVWSCVLERAATQAGRIDGWDSEDVGAGLDLDAATVDRIIGAMQGKTLDGLAVVAWAKRQPKREDGSAERAKAWRDAKREAAAAAQQAGETICALTPDPVSAHHERTENTNAADLDPEQANAGERDQTQSNARGEERRVESKISPPLTSPPLPETEGTADAVLTDEARPVSKRGKRLPRDWTPDEDDRTFAKQHGFTEEQIDGLRDEFRDYWCDVPGARGCKVSWSGTWRNRVRDRGTGLTGGSGPSDRRGARQGSSSFLAAAARAAARHS